MANSEHVSKLKESVQLWNEWRQAVAVRPDLPVADLRSGDLRGADLRNADLRAADLRGSDLQWADLDFADLTEARLTRGNLQGADLRRAILHWTDLRSADLRNTNLRGTHFYRTRLDDADFERAQVGRTQFSDTDLRATKGLNTVIHDGPSIIGIDTLYRSDGNIPETFLRGCGVPDIFIVYAASLVVHPIEFYSAFISYSSNDHAFAERLHADLRARSLRVWFAPEDLKIGERFHERIEETLKVYDKVMIVLSHASVKSRWVEREVNAAREREDRENRTVLFPIRIDDAIVDATAPWAADLRRTRHIGDFIRWKDHDSYKRAFERLLRDLRATENRADDAR